VEFYIWKHEERIIKIADPGTAATHDDASDGGRMTPDSELETITLARPRAGGSLSLAAEYRRVVNASITRVWENVFDWEHLPALHDAYFNRIELLRRYPLGWRVRITLQPGDASRMQVIALTADCGSGDYCVRTIEGVGAGSEIWTHLEVMAPHSTLVHVRYLVPEHRPERLARLGEKYRSMYRQLWDEDEAMMQHRELMLSQRNHGRVTSPVSLPLGHIADVRARLPLLVEFGNLKVRVLEVDNVLLAHSTVCPHWLGPLDCSEPEDGCVRCPWHGYRFDIRTGASVDGRGLRLAKAPRVHVSAEGEVALISAEPHGDQ
jgi:nitrite reductase/ring-hydroxylating ferredoxin subunit